MTKEEIVKEYQNNPVQWMMQNDCKTNKDVLYKMMELYAESCLHSLTPGTNLDAPQYEDFCLKCHAKSEEGSLYCVICKNL